MSIEYNNGMNEFESLIECTLEQDYSMPYK